VDHARLGCPPLTLRRSPTRRRSQRKRIPRRPCSVTWTPGRPASVSPRSGCRPSRPRCFPPIWSPVVNQQEHFPLVAALDWLWAAVATGNVLMTGRASDPDDRTRSGAGSFVFSMTAVWATTAVASIFAPPLVAPIPPGYRWSQCWSRWPRWPSPASSACTPLPRVPGAPRRCPDGPTARQPAATRDHASAPISRRGDVSTHRGGGGAPRPPRSPSRSPARCLPRG
jgi:hypothetical protein